MNSESFSRLVHDHVFDTGNHAAERGTRVVMWITAATMLLEIAAGWWFNSMALLADGWHMSSHAVAIGLSAMAYATARRYAKDARFTFGTWKIEILGGFASAVFLLGVAVLMLIGSVERVFSPLPIHYEEAIAIACLGLIVNIVCAIILGKVHHGHSHSHSHGHSQDQKQHHSHDHHHVHVHGPAHSQSHLRDLNLKSAYVHVLADAATSVLALGALLGAWVFGWSWLDPIMGIVGALLVAIWAKGLIAETGKILLDREMDHPVVEEIREVVTRCTNQGENQIADLHVWRVGKNVYSCTVTLVTHDRLLTPERVRTALAVHEEIVHSTIEIHFA